ncbi:MAG: SEC-C metal-binding domain-containing protein [Actinomycetota bacterium]|nr:SEC-C metal-binding domain-containing protein [Actinomycetota bacterium]
MPDTSEDRFAATVYRLLAECGPSTADDLLDALTAAGIDLPPDPADALGELLENDIAPVLPLADGRWVWLPALLDGRIFTHRLTAQEAENDAIGWDRDLSPLSMLTEIPDYQRLCDGSPLLEVFAGMDDDVLAERGVPATVDVGEGILLLPEGRLAARGAGAGDLIGVRVSPDGLDIAVVAEASPGDLAELLTPVLEASAEAPMMLDTAVWTACATDDTAFRRPVAPLGEQLTDAGFVCERELVALPGFDFESWQTESRVSTIAARHGLDEDEALAVLVIKRLHEHAMNLLSLTDDDAEDDAGSVEEAVLPLDQTAPPVGTVVRATLEFLAEPLVAAAVHDEIPAGDGRAAAALGLFAESAESNAPRAARPALRWLRGKAHERLGEIEAAERFFEQAESLDPSWPLPLLSLARYAEDRSDAERALSLLRRAGMPEDHEIVTQLQRYRPAPRTGLGRNERCWCGSGRKYKVCHLNREQVPLEDRVGWLYRKAATDVMDGEFGPLMLACARERAAYSDSPEALDRALHEDPLVLDVVLFEGGAFEDFLALRGHLLPGDERSLAEQWLLVERSVHEVVAVRPGEGMTVRDVRTGDICEVSELSASSMVRVGEFYCGRIVPVGDTMQIFGGMEPLSLIERDRLVTLLDDEPDPVDLVAFLSRRFAPPVLNNTEGEPMLLCDATLRVTDPEALAAGLDETYERVEGDGDGVWLEHVVTDAVRRIRAHLELREDQLHIHANSENRFERVLKVIRALDPSAELLAKTRQTVDEIADLEKLSGSPPAGLLDPGTSPEVAAALEEMVRNFEEAWLDQEIPALSGHPPRDCAADPTRRPDLIRLLDTFPDTGAPGTMSPGRLRKALGLS